jgi:DNA repair protein RadA/Sms
MPRRRTAFVCNSCGADTPAWGGRCPSCGAWNTLVEEIISELPPARRRGAGDQPVPAPVSAISEQAGERITSGIPELDRVLGGGLFKGSVNLIGGEPGIGKSTLMVQLAASLARAGEKVLYATGEESAGQVANRARRTESVDDGVLVLSATLLEDILTSAATTGASVLIVDSIQTIHSDELSSSPGSVAQVRHCAGKLISYAKPAGVTSLVVGHVTKDGSLAGPKVLEHLVDSVITFEGDSSHAHRLLRAAKNRFGSTNEIGVFEMTSSGLKGVAEASAYFLSKRSTSVSGSAVCVVLEGTRPFLVEIQALTTPTRYGFPQRSSSGLDSRRLPLLLAVLEKRCGLELGSQDVYVNVAGGASLSDPGADLGICLAVASSRLDKPVPVGVAVCAEVGLGGELRPAGSFERRLREASALGFSSVAGSSEDCVFPQPCACAGFSTLRGCLDDLLSQASCGGGRFP